MGRAGNVARLRRWENVALWGQAREAGGRE